MREVHGVDDAMMTYVALREFLNGLMLIAVGLFAALIWKRK